MLKGTSVIVASFIVLIFTIYGITQLRVENSFINYFKADTEIYKGMKKIDDQLGGTTPLDIILQFNEINTPDDSSDEFDLGLLEEEEERDKSQEWFTTDKINKIKEVHDYIDSLPETGKVLISRIYD